MLRNKKKHVFSSGVEPFQGAGGSRFISTCDYCARCHRTVAAFAEVSLRFCEIRLFLLLLNRLKYPFDASVKPLLRLYGSFLKTDVFPFGLFSLLSFSLSNF